MFPEKVRMVNSKELFSLFLRLRVHGLGNDSVFFEIVCSGFFHSHWKTESHGKRSSGEEP